MLIFYELKRNKKIGTQLGGLLYVSGLAPFLCSFTLMLLKTIVSEMIGCGEMCAVKAFNTP